MNSLEYFNQRILAANSSSNLTAVPCVPIVEEQKPFDPISLVYIVILASMSASFSGLNLGLMGLDVKNLELLTKGPFNNEEEARDARYAEKILPLRKRGNLLLCTILIGNVIVNSSLAIFMGELTSGIFGLLLSTGVITIFGEIVP
jgi:metal transporter CNNM